MRPDSRTYTAVEIALADTPRLFRYCLEGEPEIHLNLKGFDYAWIVRSFPWQPETRVLDVGAGYSWLPTYLANRFGCEVWAIDDFGANEPSGFWERGQDPEAYIRSHPEIRFIKGRLGERGSSPLPDGYFDCVYSASALEHVPTAQILGVWEAMDRLLRPGGTQVHALDIAFPTSRGARHVALAHAFDLLYGALPGPVRQKFAYETPLSYVRTVASSLRIRNLAAFRRNLSVLQMVLDPEVVVEPLEYTVNRVRKDGDYAARYYRVGSLLILLRKNDRQDGSSSSEEKRSAVP